MTHYTVRDGDTIRVYSDTVEGLIFEGPIEEWAEWKIERDQPSTMTIGFGDEEPTERTIGGGPYENADPQEVIDDYEENDWFETDTSRVPVFCL